MIRGTDMEKDKNTNNYVFGLDIGTRSIVGDILRFVVRAVSRQHNNEKEIQKDFEKVVDRCLADMVI